MYTKIMHIIMQYANVHFVYIILAPILLHYENLKYRMFIVNAQSTGRNNVQRILQLVLLKFFPFRWCCRISLKIWLLTNTTCFYWSYSILWRCWTNSKEDAKAAESSLKYLGNYIRCKAVPSSWGGQEGIVDLLAGTYVYFTYRKGCYHIISHYQGTALHLAVKMNNIKVVEILLKFGASPTQCFKWGCGQYWYIFPIELAILSKNP